MKPTIAPATLLTTSIMLLGLAALALIIIGLSSCGTGTVLTFGQDGITLTPPTEPILIPNTSSK